MTPTKTAIGYVVFIGTTEGRCGVFKLATDSMEEIYSFGVNAETATPTGVELVREENDDVWSLHINGVFRSRHMGDSAWPRGQMRTTGFEKAIRAVSELNALDWLAMID